MTRVPPPPILDEKAPAAWVCQYDIEGIVSINMATSTITVDAEVKARLADLAQQAGQSVDEFAEALLRRVADADVPDAISPAVLQEVRGE